MISKKTYICFISSSFSETLFNVAFFFLFLSQYFKEKIIKKQTAALYRFVKSSDARIVR